MFWNVVFALGAGIAQFLSSWLGWRITMNPINPKDPKQKRRKAIYEVLFLTVGLVGIVLVGVGAYRGARERAHIAFQPDSAYEVGKDAGFKWLSNGTIVGATFLAINQPLAFNLWYVNVGSGPAVNLSSRMHTFIEPDISATSEEDASTMFDKMKTSEPLKGSFTLPRGSKQYGSARGQILSPEDYNNLIYGRRVAYLVAELAYQDDAGKHYRHYCQALQPPMPGGVVIWADCNKYNDEN